MKTYKQFINESLLDKMVDVSDEDIKKIDPFYRIEEILYDNLDNDYYPSNEEIIEALNKLDKEEKIITIIKYKLPFNLLPDDLTINNLNIFETIADKLPTGLVINGEFNIHETNINNIDGVIFPDTLNGSFAIGETGVENFPMNIKYIKGGLYLNDIITTLPDGLTVDGDTMLGMGIIKLPENFTVHSFLDLLHSNIKEIPKTLIVDGDLMLNTKHNIVIPKECVIKGNIIIKK